MWWENLNELLGWGTPPGEPPEKEIWPPPQPSPVKGRNLLDIMRGSQFPLPSPGDGRLLVDIMRGSPGTKETSPTPEISEPEAPTYWEDQIEAMRARGLSDADIKQLLPSLLTDPLYRDYQWRDPSNKEKLIGVTALTPSAGATNDLLNEILGGGTEAEGAPRTMVQEGYVWQFDPIAGEWTPIGRSYPSPQEETRRQQELIWAESPSKYYIQRALAEGQVPMTPEVIARLQGVEPGTPLEAKPMSTPSLQFWSGLLPEEQQQVLGTADWLGISPETFMDIYRRMIPGVADRIPLRWNR